MADFAGQKVACSNFLHPAHDQPMVKCRKIAEFKDFIMFRGCPRPLRIVLLLVGLSFSAGELGSNAVAQKVGSQIQNVFLPAPRELRQHISRAKEAIDERRFDEAVSELGTLLVSPDAEDYFIGPLGGAGTQTSLKVEAQRLLGDMPGRALETYELKFGSDARQLLDEALQAADMQKLTNVTRMYFHTKAGYEATMLLGRHHLDQGRPLAGALCFQRVLASPVGETYDPALSIMLSTCWLYANREQKAEQILNQLKLRGASTFQAGGGQKKLFRADEDPIDWLTKLTGKAPGGQKTGASEWLVHRGDKSRNGQARGGLPLPSLRWRVPTVNDPTDEETVKEIASVYDAAKTAALPGLHPLAVRDTVLMRTGDNLIAVDFTNGKRIWEWPWDNDSTYARDWQGSAPTITTAGKRQISPRRKELQQRIWDDAPHGQLSSDGEAVFLLDRLGVASPTGPPVRIGFGGVRATNDRFRAHNRLVALDLASEGSLMWMVDGEPGNGYSDEPRLAGAFFLGTPLPLMGQLYALAEINSEIRLVALDRKTGELQWSQQVAQVESNPILFDGPRRLAGASPSFADGILVCPTSSGAVVAVDTTTRSLLWGFQYPRAVRYYNRGFGRVTATDNRPFGSRWNDATVTISDGHVVITPVESNEMYCLDLLTGKPVWEKGKTRDNLLHVACMHGGNVVMAGKNEVTALRLQDGEQAWSIPLGNDVRPSGRGFFSDGHYYLPTTSSKILKIDVSEGSIISDVETDFVLGNLICYKGEVISHGPDWLATFPQDGPLRVNVRQRLDKNPDDTWALARKAELLMKDGKRNEALTTARRAFELDPTSDSTRAVLGDALLVVVRHDFLGNRKVTEELEGFVDRPEQKAELLRHKALGFLKVGDLNAAFRTFVGLAGFHVDGESTELQQFPIESVERHHSVRHDRWVTARLSELYKGLDTKDAAAIDSEIKNLLTTALKSGNAQVLNRFLQFFGFHPTASQARLALLESLVAAGDYLQAEHVALRLMVKPNEKTEPAVNALYAELLAKSGKFDSAAAQYHRVAQQWGNVVCRNGKTGRQLLDEVSKQQPLAQSINKSNQWLYGEPEITEGAKKVDNYGRTSSNQISPIDVRQRDGEFPHGLRVLYDRTNFITVRNGQGKQLLQVSLNRTDAVRRYYAPNYAVIHAKVKGHLLIVSLGYELVAIDMLSQVTNPAEAILWRRELVQIVPDALNPNMSALRAGTKALDNPWGATRYQALDASQRPIGAMASISDNGFCFMRQNELVCVDPLTGKILWTRGGFEIGSDTFGDDEFVFVVGPSSDEAQAIRLVDGKLLGTRPVPNYGSRWTSHGRRTLSWVRNGDSLHLNLTDIWTQKEILKHIVSYDSKACLVEHDEVAVMQADGRFAILSLSQGVKRFECQLEEEKKLTNLYVLRSADQYLVVANSPSTSDSKVNIQSAPIGIHSPLVSGNLFALDRQTGKSQWDRPIRIDRFGFPLDQATEVPTLTFLRHETPQTKSGPRKYQSSILMIDRRDGRQLLSKQDIPARTDSYQIEGNPSQQLVSVRLPGKVLNIKFTDRPIVVKPDENTGANIGRTNASESQVSSNESDRFQPLQNVIDVQQVQLRRAIENQAVERARK